MSVWTFAIYYHSISKSPREEDKKGLREILEWVYIAENSLKNVITVVPPQINLAATLKDHVLTS